MFWQGALPHKFANFKVQNEECHYYGLGKPSFFWRSSIMILTLDPLSSNMSSTKFFPTWIKITTMWRSITTKVIILFNSKGWLGLGSELSYVKTYCLG